MRNSWVIAVSLLGTLAVSAPADTGSPIRVRSPMSPPTWALLERELLRANARACEEFFDRYFDERGYLRCVERWGGDDGPDDAAECVKYWTLLYALGAPDRLLELFEKSWEGHLRQYTAARTSQVPFAREGMYYKEFPVMFDWMHTGEGLTSFHLFGLCKPQDPAWRERVKRFAGFYMNEDPGAPNYDPEHRVIRSLFTGSRGPLLRDATALDWAGDPIEVEHRFSPRHGERNYQEMLRHFEDYTDVVGDHAQNLLATYLALNAYLLDHEPKYRDWLLQYVDAWAQRMADNGGIIPTKVGLDGTIGGSAGKWYDGVYGWAFSVTVPQTGQIAHRNNHRLGFHGFANAFLLTGKDRYLDVWRRQIDSINALARQVDGKTMVPTMHGAQGWYAFLPKRYEEGALELSCFSREPRARALARPSGWLTFLEGKDPGYPERVLRADLAAIRMKVDEMRRDPTTPDARLADDPMLLNPAASEALVPLMLGGPHPGRWGGALHCRVRYFDPVHRRAGIPQDVAALVEKITDGEVALHLVNLDPLEDRQLLIQTGAYGEHQCRSVVLGEEEVPIDGSFFEVRLAPGTGARLVVRMDCFVNTPTLAHPWDRR